MAFSEGQKRTPLTVRTWLKKHHVLFYATDEHLDRQSVQCNCCHSIPAIGETVYWWENYERTANAVLCGYCDVQARILATDFVKKLKHAIFNPEEFLGSES